MTAFYHNSPNPTTKICIDCLLEKPLDAYYRGCTRCKPCEQLRRKQRSQERLKQYENLSPDTTKVCTVCHTEKSLDDFYKQGAGILGRTAMCKICTIEAAGYMNHMKTIPPAQHGGKVCHECLQEKPLDAFYKEAQRKDGLALICKECSSAYHLDYAYKTGKRKRSAPLPKSVNGGKVCTKCMTEKPLDDFAKSKDGKGGYNPLCKECANAYGREQYAMIYKERKLEKNHQWYEANQEKHHQLTRAWRQANRLKNNQYSKKRYAQKKGVTVGEVDYVHILERDGMWCYICEKDILPEDRIEFDHVIPIDRNGAHSEDNIKVTHHKCNRRKCNKHLCEMTPYQRRGIR